MRPDPARATGGRRGLPVYDYTQNTCYHKSKSYRDAEADSASPTQISTWMFVMSGTL